MCDNIIIIDNIKYKLYGLSEEFANSSRCATIMGIVNNVKEIYIPKKITYKNRIYDVCGSENDLHFEYSPELENIYVEDSHEFFYVEDNILYHIYRYYDINLDTKVKTDKLILNIYPAKKKGDCLMLNNKVIYIYYTTFLYTKYLKTLVIPNEITEPGLFYSTNLSFFNYSKSSLNNIVYKNKIIKKTDNNRKLKII